MEREEAINTELAEDESRKEKFPNLFIAAAILFGVNVVLALFFYFSPKVLAGTTNIDDQSNQYAIAKASAFEERVKETPHIARAAEKVRPIIEASISPQDSSTDGADLSVTSYTNTNDSAYQPASYTMNAGDRSAASGSEVSNLTASLSSRGSGLN